MTRNGRSMRLLLVMALAAVPLAGACAHRLPLQAPHDWQLRGAVVAMDDAIVRVRYKTGEVYAFTVDEQTAYVRNKRAASRDVLRVGARVIVDLHSQDATNRALRVQIVFGGAPAP